MADSRKAAKPYKRKEGIKDTEGSNFGNYAESTGGGHPFDKGNSNTRTTRENGKIRKEEGSPDQPRTSDGKFTYNSVNGKGLKYEARGKTVNPLLTGGENGIMIDEVERQFDAKSGKYWDKYQNDWYRVGSEKIVGFRGGKSKTKTAMRSIWNIAREKYSDKLGKFELEEGNWDKSKSGRIGKEEKAAMAQAKKTGEEQYVMSQQGGIKVNPAVAKRAKAIAGQMAGWLSGGNAKPAPQSPVSPSQGTADVDSGEKPTTSNGLAHSEKEISDLKAFLGDPEISKAIGGFDVSDYSDEQLDALYDQFGDEIKSMKDAGLFGIKEEKSEYDEAPESDGEEGEGEEGDSDEKEEEADSDAVKKVKSMGFSE